MATKFQAYVPRAAELVCDVIAGGKEELQCKFCGNVLHNPHQLSCCRRHSCEKCVDKMRKSISNSGLKCCPFCKKSKRITTKLNMGLLSQVNILKVHCPNFDSGCAWEGRLNVAAIHIALRGIQGECQYQKVKCKYQECKSTPLRKDLIRHETGLCKFRPYKCKYCLNFNSTFEIVTTQHYLVCAKFPVPCPNECTRNLMPRGSVQKHLEQCPLQKVSCDFQSAGCNFVEVRKDLSDHHRACHLQHSSLLAKQNATLQIMLVKTELKLEDMVRQQEEQARFQAHLQEEIKQQQSHFQALLKKRFKEVAEQQAEQEAHFKVLLSKQETKYQQELSSLKGKLDEVKRNASKEVNRLSRDLNAQIAETEAKLASKTKELNSVKRELNLLNTCHNQTVLAYDQKIEQLSTQCKQLKIKTAQLKTEINDLQDNGREARNLP